MKPSAANIVDPQDYDLYLEIKEVLEQLPDMGVLGTYEDGVPITLNCHTLSHALARFFPVECKDGYFYGKWYEHSWLVTKRQYVIIDVYPVAVLSGPILIDMRFRQPWDAYYEEACVPRLNDISFPPCVAKVCSQIQMIVEARKKD